MMEVQRRSLTYQDLAYTPLLPEEGLGFLALQGIIMWLKGCIPSTLFSQNLNMGNKNQESYHLNHILFDLLENRVML